MKKYAVIGLMSGTSLDGLDVAYVEFIRDNNWSFNTIECKTLKYGVDLDARLRDASNLSAIALKRLDIDFGKWIGEQVKQFINKKGVRPDLIASHGHTIFHQPEIGITMQIGDGNQIMLQTGIKTISDFRALDVANGGQGAPLVPIGDKFLFSNYDLCLNLGGFSNVSMEHQGERIAFDICPVNTVLNHLSGILGKPFDKNGAIAKTGKVNPKLLAALNALPYYQQAPPKSLGIEWVQKNIFPIMIGDKPENLLATYCQHVADQVINAVLYIMKEQNTEPKMLVTGGGAHNTFLIESIKKEALGRLNIVIPENQIVDFKEAIIFAFLGVLRSLNEINTLKSVTGAKTSSSGGTVFDSLIA